jgi:hypothetical protein
LVLFTRKKNWVANLTLEAKTTITPLPFLDREYYRKQEAERIETLYTRDSLHSTHTTHSEMMIKRQLKHNEAMITKADKGNSIVILPCSIMEYKPIILRNKCIKIYSIGTGSLKISSPLRTQTQLDKVYIHTLPTYIINSRNKQILV